jgi:hypothetical protein
MIIDELVVQRRAGGRELRGRRPPAAFLAASSKNRYVERNSKPSHDLMRHWRPI